tara:strand:- start:1108 stop:1317 length:210 start_codon:yes stop_codon:yes gene_type:complete
MHTIHILFKDGNKKTQCFYSDNWTDFPDVYKLYGLKAAINKLQEEYNKQKLLIAESEAANENEAFVFYV